MKSLLESAKTHWIFVSFIFSITTFLLGVSFSTIRFSHYGFDYFLFYDLSDYLKVTAHSLSFWVISLLCLLAVIVMTAVGCYRLQWHFKAPNRTRFETIAFYIELLTFLWMYMFIVVVSCYEIHRQTKVSFEWTTNGFSDIYQIKTRTEGLAFNCINLVDVNSDNLFVWDHMSKQIVVIPKANVAAIRLIHDEMPSKNVFLGGGGNGAGYQPPKPGEEGEFRQSRLYYLEKLLNTDNNTTPKSASYRERYNVRLADWYNSVNLVCPERVNKNDIIDRMYMTMF